jgi:hypothetical protein
VTWPSSTPSWPGYVPSGRPAGLDVAIDQLAAATADSPLSDEQRARLILLPTEAEAEAEQVG